MQCDDPRARHAHSLSLCRNRINRKLDRRRPRRARPPALGHEFLMDFACKYAHTKAVSADISCPRSRTCAGRDLSKGHYKPIYVGQAGGKGVKKGKEDRETNAPCSISFLCFSLDENNTYSSSRRACWVLSLFCTKGRKQWDGKPELQISLLSYKKVHQTNLV